MKRFLKLAASVLFWLGVWALAAWRMDSPLLLPAPGRVLLRLWTLAGSGAFWKITGMSLLRVLGGLLLSVVVGILLAAATERFGLMRALFSPLLSVIRATPVASFIILAILWMGRDVVPVFIVVLMALPVVWGNVCAGIRTTDRGLLQMAKVYQFPPIRRLRRVWIPSVMPHFLSGVRTALGLAWKAGVAAEVLTVPKVSIGKMLMDTKLNLEVEEMFAWTIMVILLSFAIEGGLLALLNQAGAACDERGGEAND